MHKFSWRRELARSDLRDAKKLLTELFPQVVEAGIATDSEAHRLRFAAWAAEVDRTWHSQRNPLGNFSRRLVAPDRYGRTWLQRGLAKQDEDRARALLAAVRPPPSSIAMPSFRSPVVARVASIEDQKRRLRERGLLQDGDGRPAVAGVSVATTAAR